MTKCSNSGKTSIFSALTPKPLCKFLLLLQIHSSYFSAVLPTFCNRNTYFFFQLFSSPSYFLLVMDFCPGDQLWTLVHCNSGLPEPIACIIFKQVVKPIIYVGYDDSQSLMCSVIKSACIKLNSAIVQLVPKLE